MILVQCYQIVDSYEGARDKLKIAEISSDLQTDAEAAKTDKRPKRYLTVSLSYLCLSIMVLIFYAACDLLLEVRCVQTW